MFLEPKLVEYKQFGKDFIPWLSIIDTLMFNSVDEIRWHLGEFNLI